jgi:hypothetical protein
MREGEVKGEREGGREGNAHTAGQIERKQSKIQLFDAHGREKWIALHICHDMCVKHKLLSERQPPS